MDWKLRASDDELHQRFLSLSSPVELSLLLDIRVNHFFHLLYGQDLSNNYTEFSIHKKGGDIRTINSPSVSLKLIQRRLNQVLHTVYSPKKPVHGFCKSRSIISNAKNHLKKKFVLNIDLSDFFPSINFGRVRGVFIAPPFNLPENVATVVAQICCLNNALPQGAPTSPIVSNIICSKMDRQLQLLAKNHMCTYTRYADDITFSTSNRNFPETICTFNLTDDPVLSEVHIGTQLSEIISRNGFHINNSKTRMFTKFRRQEVTGLKVNVKLNVSRNYIRQIRAMLHAWRVYGYENAEQEYRERYCTPNRHPSKPEISFINVINGKLNYLRMVRGEDDHIYRKFINKLDLLQGNRPRYFLSRIEEAASALWVLECDQTSRQGTAFMLSNYGLITCDHVLGTNTLAFKYSEPSKKYKVTIDKRNPDIDLAIISLHSDKMFNSLNSDLNENINQADEVLLFGHPNYRLGDIHNFSKGHVTSFRPVSGITRILIDTPIIAGCSGGPVLNNKFKVIGVAVTGADSMVESINTENHGVIPISALRYLIEG